MTIDILFATWKLEKYCKQTNKQTKTRKKPIPVLRRPNMKNATKKNQPN